MVYNNFIKALSEGDDAKIDCVCKQITPILKRHLMSRLSASEMDANDATQQTLLIFYERWKNKPPNKVKNPYSYVITILRREYFKIKKMHAWTESIEPYMDNSVEPSQTESLYKNDADGILVKCLSKLNENNRLFVEFIIANPDANTVAIAKHFQLSKNNVSTRKHRLLKIIIGCVNKNISSP